ncbi:MAG: PAS domain S-box protein, partial [Halothiobacillaceae bacterium]
RTGEALKELLVLVLPGAPSGIETFARNLCPLRIGCRVSMIDALETRVPDADYLLLALDDPDPEVIAPIRARLPGLAVVLVLGDELPEAGLLQRVQDAGAHEFIRISDLEARWLRRVLDSADVNFGNERLQNRFQVLLDRTPDGFWINDLQGRILEVNPAFCRMVGHSREALLQMTIPDLEVRESAEETAAHIAYVIEHGSDHFQTMQRHADGHVIHMDVSAHRIDEGGQTFLMVIFRDISEQVVLAHAREEADRRFRDVAEAAGEYIWEVDRSGRYTFVTDAIAKVLGRPAETLIGRTPIEFMPDEDARMVRDFLAVHVDASDSWRNLEHRSIRPNGCIVWQRVSGMPVFDRDNRLVGFRGTARDITEERMAEEARARLTERLQLASSAAGLGIWDYEVSTGRLEWDAGMHRIYGTSPERFEAHFESWQSLLTDDSRAQALDELNAGLVSDGPYASEFSILRPDGETRQIRALARAIRDAEGHVLRVVGINEDITERKAVQQALQRSEAELAEAQRIAHLGNWVSDFVVGEIRWSAEVYRIFGLAPEQWEATHEAFMRAVHPEDRERVSAAVAASLLPDGAVYDITHRILRPDGTVRHVYQCGHVEFSATGEPLRMLGVVLDITDRFKLEEALRTQRDTAHGVIDSLPGIFYMVSKTRSLSLWNLNLNRVTGLDDKALARLDMTDLFAPEDRGRLETGLARALEEGQARLEARLIAADAGKVPYDLSMHRLDLNSETLLIGNGIDISERVRLEAELRWLATTDPLTGVFNRRHFMDRSHQALAAALQAGEELSLIMLDVDHFKSVNDRHGHEAGDRVLKGLASILSQQLREDDLVGRLGGEEFAVLLPGTDRQLARTVAERIRARIEASPVPIRCGVLHITASLGVATLDAHDETVDRLLVRADAALYCAKDAGRNRVHAAG